MDNDSVIPLPVDLSATIERLRTDLETIQRELDQALTVWRTSLINEKKEFQALLQEKEKRWSEHEARIEQDASAFDQKVRELEDHYKSQVETLEQNALQALNELDDSWQRDKLLWNQSVFQRMHALENREALLSKECEKRDQRIRELEAALTGLPLTAPSEAVPVSSPVEKPPVVPMASPPSPVLVQPPIEAPKPEVADAPMSSPPVLESSLTITSNPDPVVIIPVDPVLAKTALELLEEQVLALDRIVKMPVDGPEPKPMPLNEQSRESSGTRDGHR